MEIKEKDHGTETIPLPILEIRESACGRYSILTNLRRKFTAEFPKDWEILAYLTAGFGGQFFAAKIEDAADVNVNLVMTPVERDGALAQVVQENKNEIIAKGIPVTTGHIDIKGQLWHVISTKSLINPKPEAKTKHYFTQMAGVIYVFTFEYLQHRLCDYEDQVFQILQTIRPIE